MTFTALCIPILFHGTLKNFISRTTKIFLIFFSVTYGPNDNFQYIIRFRKKNLTRLSLKKLHVPIKKKKVDYR
jgi:hypothetical protein